MQATACFLIFSLLVAFVKGECHANITATLPVWRSRLCALPIHNGCRGLVVGCAIKEGFFVKAKLEACFKPTGFGLDTIHSAYNVLCDPQNTKLADDFVCCMVNASTEEMNNSNLKDMVKKCGPAAIPECGVKS